VFLAWTCSAFLCALLLHKLDVPADHRFGLFSIKHSPPTVKRPPLLGSYHSLTSFLPFLVLYCKMIPSST